MKNFIIENKNLVILWVLCGIALFIFCGHYGNILLDIGREIYYPEQILKGKVLYKDLFNIYGPFSYLFNALLYKIFSPNLGTLYFAGTLCSFSIVTGIYLIAKKFLSEFFSFAIALFTIVTGICAVHLFNFTLPYSWAMLYGTVSFVYSVLALVKFKQENKTQYLYLSALLAGISVCNKYDFFIYAIFLFIVALFTKNKKIILNFITSFAIFPLICIGTLYIQGVRFHDIITSLNYIRDMISTKSLNDFYTVQGIYFNKKIILLWIINLIKTGFGFGGLLFGYKLTEKNKALGYIICGIFAILIAIFTTPIVFIFLVPLLILTAIFTCLKLKDNIPLCFFAMAAISISAKCFWALHPLNYGNYSISIILIAFFATLFTVLDKKYEKYVAIGLIAISLNFLWNACNTRYYLDTKVSTNKGTIYTYEKNAETTNSVIKYLQENNAQSALIFPEGLLINFLTSINADDTYNSLLPLYAESFGEEKYIAHFKETQPQYFVMNNLSMYEYGAGHICDSYADTFCRFLLENYSQEKDINDGFRYIIFKNKNIK